MLFEHRHTKSIHNHLPSANMDAYTSFLTLSNVRDFILYIYGNNLTHHEHFADFIRTLEFHKYIGSSYNSCKRSCVNCCNENSNSCARCCIIYPCCPCMTLYNCISCCLCRNVRHILETCAYVYADRYVTCCESGHNECVKCCNVKTKHTFVERVRDKLLHADYHEMLQGYPPYVAHCIKSCLFRVIPTCDFSNNIATYHKRLRLHVNSLPIDETFDEFAFYSFVLNPEYQLQILSHALTFGERCCETCKNVDRYPSMFFNTREIGECALSVYYVTFAYNNTKRHYQFTNIVFARFLMRSADNSCVYSPNLHTYLLHLIPYRDYLYAYAKRVFRFMLMHEETYANFDKNNVGHHVFCNEYIARKIHKFLQ